MAKEFVRTQLNARKLIPKDKVAKVALRIFFYNHLIIKFISVTVNKTRKILLIKSLQMKYIIMVMACRNSNLHYCFDKP